MEQGHQGIGHGWVRSVMRGSRLCELTTVAAAAATVFLAAGCGSSSSGSAVATTDPSASATVAPAGDPSSDKLAQVEARGTVVLFTDPAYPPQSFAVKGATRKATTKCAPNQMTANQMTGYDAETGKLVAKGLGVEPCFVTPSWTEVTGGNWGDRWDLAYGSGAVALDRMDVLYMTQPYYSTPTNFFVPTASTAKTPAGPLGQEDRRLRRLHHGGVPPGSSDLPGPKVETVVKNPNIVTFDTEVPGSPRPRRGSSMHSFAPSPSGRGRSRRAPP